MFCERCLYLQARLKLRKKWSSKEQQPSGLFCTVVPHDLFFISVRSQCGGDLTTDSGEITSPRFPSSYPDNANCEWKIAVDDGSGITLTFVMFEV